MDVRYIRLLMCFIALPNTSPALIKVDLTQNVSSTLPSQGLPKSQLLYSSSSKAEMLQNTAILSNSSQSQNLIRTSPKPTQGLSKFFQVLRNTSLEPSDILINMSNLLREDSLKYISDLLFNMSDVISKPISEPIQFSLTNTEDLENNSSNVFFNLLFNTSEVILRTSPELLELLSNDTYKQPGINITLTGPHKFFLMDVNGTILRRQGRPVNSDILYSKPPNRYYAKQVATYGDGSTEPTTTPVIYTFNNTCDYDAYYCLKMYSTGLVCARTMFYNFHTFPNVCLMEYTNCYFGMLEWTLAYMGRCIDLPHRYGFYMYPYQDNSYLKRIHIYENINSLPIDLY